MICGYIIRMEEQVPFLGRRAIPGSDLGWILVCYCVYLIDNERIPSRNVT